MFIAISDFVSFILQRSRRLVNEHFHNHIPPKDPPSPSLQAYRNLEILDNRNYYS